MNEWDRQVFIAETGIDPVAQGEEAMSHCEWRPVESCPKDGRFFYVINSGNALPILARYSEMAEGIIVHLARDAQEYTTGTATATHWMPLPPPPEE